MKQDILYEDTIPGGRHWSLIVPKGHTLRLTDVDGGANVGMLLYNPNNPLERLNIPDTLKCQHTFKLRKDHCLYSDMGRIFAVIGEDSVGWHDAATGTCNKQAVQQRWGELNYQQAQNDYYRNGYDSFLIELGKYGLGKRDLAANINFFSKIEANMEGDLHYAVDHSQTGDYVELCFQLNTLAVFHTCPHPLNPSKTYPRRAINYQLRANDSTPQDENLCPENQRGFMNNYLYQLGE